LEQMERLLCFDFFLKWPPNLHFLRAIVCIEKARFLCSYGNSPDHASIHGHCCSLHPTYECTRLPSFAIRGTTTD
uniref:Ovule protein n=1 Tax=Haemonchus placei TaxID=6290 RepID=A0A0N4WNS0_HAEPC